MTHECLPSVTHEWGTEEGDDLGGGARALVQGEGGGMESGKEEGRDTSHSWYPALDVCLAGLGA